MSNVHVPYQSVYDSMFSTIDDLLKFYHADLESDYINLRVAECVRGFAPEEYIPDYCNDLNLAWEMEESLRLTGPWLDYIQCLGRIFMRDLNGKGVWEMIRARTNDSIHHSLINFTHATAKQRCLAFLIYHAGRTEQETQQPK